jgi:hypothetical protein
MHLSGVLLLARSVMPDERLTVLAKHRYYVRLDGEWICKKEPRGKSYLSLKDSNVFEV